MNDHGKAELQKRLWGHVVAGEPIPQGLTLALGMATFFCVVDDTMRAGARLGNPITKETEVA